MTPPSTPSGRPGIGGTGRFTGTGRPPAGAAIDVAAGPLANALWLERELLEQLLFALTSQQLLLQAGQVRWLAAADAQLQSAVDAVAECELRRAVASTRVAAILGLGGAATLHELAQAAPAPWDMLLADHRDVLRTLAGEIATTTTENRRLLHAGAEATREALAHVGLAVTEYVDSPTGVFAGAGKHHAVNPLTGHSVLLDRQA